jgi:hypothetical protein
MAIYYLWANYSNRRGHLHVPRLQTGWFHQVSIASGNRIIDAQQRTLDYPLRPKRLRRALLTTLTLHINVSRSGSDWSLTFSVAVVGQGPLISPYSERKVNFQALKCFWMNMSNSIAKFCQRPLQCSQVGVV